MLWLEVVVTYEVVGAGRVVSRSVSVDPFVRNFREFLRGLMNPDYVAMFCRHTDGSSFQGRVRHPAGLGVSSGILDVMGGEGDHDVGIVVGSVQGSRDFNRCSLASRVDHEDDVFEYKAVEDLGFTTVGGNVVWRVRRAFDNLSTSPVNVWESGVYASMIVTDATVDSPLAGLVMVALDVRDTAFVVEAGQRLVVTYDFILGMPPGWSL